jgi:hypothetical protein
VTERLTIDDFAPHVEVEFPVQVGDVQHVLRLTEASPQGAADDAGRQPFTLVFSGPAEPLLEQATYPLEHPALGRLDVFLVPMARDATGTRYTAVFG